jgi:hypothetical protein
LNHDRVISTIQDIGHELSALIAQNVISITEARLLLNMESNPNPGDQNLKPFQERVISEKAELDARINKLFQFLADQTPVSREEQDRLSKQLRIMDEYSAVLNERILNFNK